MGLTSFPQSLLPEGHCVAPVIIATDKTQLSQFSGNKSAYPVYLTLGNIPRALRRKPSEHACILIGYLSVSKISKVGITKQQRTARIQRLFHSAMRLILQPLIKAGKDGMEVAGGDGSVRIVHPVLASYVADYPEQCLVGCTKYGTCPKCKIKHDDLQNEVPAAPRTAKGTLHIIEEAKRTSSTTSSFFTTCMDSDVAGGVYEPFWKGFPFCDIHTAITPDVLHQLYQGIFKHLLSWCQTMLGEAELDRRVRCLPPMNGNRHFANGVSGLSQVTGTERKHMARILLGCLVGSIPIGALRAIRALLDFIYLAQYTTHNDDTLGYLKDALDTFHANKDTLIELGVRDDFNFPKIHSLHHYITSIELFGTTDNYNTEMFERFHIDFAKDGWRASNKRNERPQMVKWLVRQERIALFEGYLNAIDRLNKPPPPLVLTNPLGLGIRMKKTPHHIKKLLTAIETTHHCPWFRRDLKAYLNSVLDVRDRVARAIIEDAVIPFDNLDIYYSFKFSSLRVGDDNLVVKDWIKAQPTRPGQAERFDTIVAMDTVEAEASGLEGENTFCVL